ncbi:MAG TPA: hotdog domain-containing protein [Planosporangium sp.]|jgi:predicted thioesterase|nr:hotdog domain-containing protein [Planosporangium sp.]
MRPDEEAPDTVPTDGQASPAIGRAHVGGPGGGSLEATASWVGAGARVQLTVTDADTAQAVGSGDVPVLGMPRILALVEAATVGATANRLPPGATTVGTRVELEHRAHTPVGRTVVAEARLAKADGRRLTFEVSVRDGDTVAAEGRVERIVVDRHRFVEKAFGGP